MPTLRNHPRAKRERIRSRSAFLRIKSYFSRPDPVLSFIFIFLIISTITAYQGVRHNDFINLDDNLYVTENLHVQKGISARNILWAFTSTENGQWHPLTWLSHMIDYHLFRLDAHGHHMTNLLFHVMNSLLVFILLYRMTGAPWQSGFVASLFALHPLHVESVAWISERRDVLYAFFWFLALWVHTQSVKYPNRYWRILLFLCFLFAVMSKSMAVTLPVALLLLDYWPLDRFKRKEGGGIPKPFTASLPDGKSRNLSLMKLFSEKLSLLIVAAGISLYTVISNLKVHSLTSLDKLPITSRFQNAAVSSINYISEMFWPHPLAILYPHPMNLPRWEVAWSFSLMVIITMCVIIFRKKRPYLLMGWMWYLVTLLPVMGLVQAGVQGMADRFTYIPMIGLFIMVVYGISDILRDWRLSKVVLSVAGGVVLILLMLCTGSQVKHWRNSTTLFEHTLNVTTGNYLIHNNLGVTLTRQGKYQEALFHFQKALELDPQYSDAYYNLGSLLARQGKDEEAMVQWMTSLRIKPDKKEAHNDLGVLLYKSGKTQEAIDHFTQAIWLDPYYEEPYFNLGTLFFKQKKYAEAILYFNEVLRINPSSATAHNSLATALVASGKYQEALSHYHQALQINKNYADAHYNLGSLLYRLERPKEAILEYDEVLKIHPNDARVHYELGVILDRDGKRQEAILHLSEAIRIVPNYEEAHLALGEIYLKMKKRDLAYHQYRILRTINKVLANRLFWEISKDQDKP